MKTILLLLSILLIGCQSTSETTQVGIDGTWRISGSVDDGFSWYIQYTFDAGSFTMEGYPPIDSEGTYTLLSEDENTFLIEIDPNEGDPYQATLILSEDGSTLDWAQQIYTRVN